MNPAPVRYSDCHGCSLCNLVCPVWQTTHDIRLTPKGRARALQHQVSAAELKNSTATCTLCGACNLVCPQGIDSVDIVLDLRRQLLQANRKSEDFRYVQNLLNDIDYSNLPSVLYSSILLPDKALTANNKILRVVQRLLDSPNTIIYAWKLTECIEVGMEIPLAQQQAFIKPLKNTQTIIVADGLLMRTLQRWLPDKRIISLGMALSHLENLRKKLTYKDLYFIHPRAYHASFEESLTYYAELKKAIGCDMNIDLQHMSQSIAGIELPENYTDARERQSRRIATLLESKKFDRIVTESLEDGEILRKMTDRPILYLAELVA